MSGKNKLASVDPDLYEWVREEAKKDRTSIAGFIRRLIMDEQKLRKLGEAA